MKRTFIFDIPIENVRRQEAVEQIRHALEQPWHHPIFFVNANCVNIARRDEEFYTLLQQSHHNYVDGIGMMLAGKTLGTPFVDNVNGTDLFPLLCAALRNTGIRIFLLGGEPGVAETLREKLTATYPGINICGIRDGYFSPQEEPAVVRQIADARTDLLLVAMGVPLQEKWIARCGAETGARVTMGVGGLFNFYSGRIPRAPLWMRRFGLEWLHRLFKEPRRLWRRYVLGNVTFLLALGREKVQLRLNPKRAAAKQESERC